jgi:MYXO-CTERM domain-containing protein
VATLPVTLTGPTSLSPIANPLLGTEPRYGPYTATVTNNTAATLTVDYAVLGLISPDGAFQGTGGWSTGILPEPYPAAITLAPGQSAEYVSSGDVYAVGPVGDTAEISFWTEYSSFPAADHIAGCYGEGGTTVPPASQYSCAPTPYAVDGGPVPDPDFYSSFCLPLCVQPEVFAFPPSKNPGYEIVGGAAVLDLTIVDEPSAAALLAAALGLLALLRRRTCTG